MLFDTEHSPGDPLIVLAQLRAVARCQVSHVVRPLFAHSGRPRGREPQCVSIHSTLLG